MPKSQSKGSGSVDLLMLGGLALGGYLVYQGLKNNGGGGGGGGDGTTGSATIQIDNPANVPQDMTCVVKNIGTTTQTFGVGCSVGMGATNSSEVPGQGCGVYFIGQVYYDLPLQSITLSPGQSKTIHFALQPRQYGGMIIVKVWSKTSNITATDCLDGDWTLYNTPE